MVERAAFSIFFVAASSLLACGVYDSSLLDKASSFEMGDGGADETMSDPQLDDSGLFDLPDGSDGESDAGIIVGMTDASLDAGPDAGVMDAASDAVADAGDDQGADSGGPDAGADSGSSDSGQDAGDQDAGDAGMPDECPGDPDKIDPGTCGCGIPENCAGLVDSLVTRYRFDGTDTTIVDAKGGANGTASKALSGDGSLALSGENSGDHATLPAGLLSGFSTATVEFWFTWQGGTSQQRALSFGTATPNSPSQGCPNDPEYRDGSWYEFCDGVVVWNVARSRCEGAGGYLAVIESDVEQQYLATKVTAGTWFGGNDVETEGQWYFANAGGLSAGPHFWSGNGSGSAVSGAYANWNSGYPLGDAGYDCAYITTNKKWLNYTCDNGTAYYWCEWDHYQGSSMDRGVWFTVADGSGQPQLVYKAGGSSVVAQGTDAVQTGVQTHVALVLDPGASGIALYIDGELAASATSSDPLSELRDVDNWLGRSHIASDPDFSGSLHELRIYDRALTANELTTSDLAGPDPGFLE